MHFRTQKTPFSILSTINHQLSTKLNSNLAIKAENISKQYRLGEVGTGTITHDLNRAWARLRGKEDPFLKIGESNDRSVKGESDYVWSLKDINFEIQKGDAVGIIGRNGAGKSTLLKLLSRVTKPTTGHFEVQGRIASLLEVGTGFNPEMTGRENIFLNGAILGMRRQEIKRKFDEIVDFAGVERYIDTPVKRYSSGMYVRLAFAVAAHLESEILIVDEVLAVGDAEFQKKCLGKMGDVSKGEGRTVLFVSHNMAAINQFCEKGIYLKNGVIASIDSVKRVTDIYMTDGEQINSSYFAEANPNIDLYFDSIIVTNEEGVAKSIFDYDDKIGIMFNISQKTQFKHATIFVTVQDAQSNKIFSAEVGLDYHTPSYKLNILSKFLNKGIYNLTTFIHIPNMRKFDYVENICHFEIVDNKSEFSKYGDFNHGYVYGNYFWT